MDECYFTSVIALKWNDFRWTYEHKHLDVMKNIFIHGNCSHGITFIQFHPSNIISFISTTFVHLNSLCFWQLVLFTRWLVNLSQFTQMLVKYKVKHATCHRNQNSSYYVIFIHLTSFHLQFFSFIHQTQGANCNGSQESTI